MTVKVGKVRSTFSAHLVESHLSAADVTYISALLCGHAMRLTAYLVHYFILTKVSVGSEMMFSVEEIFRA